MEMRELRGDDVFTVMAILGKLDLKDELVKAFETGAMDSKKDGKKLSKAEIEARGVRVTAALIQQVLKNITAVREDINSLLADLTGKTTDDIKQLSITEYTKLIVAFTKKPELKEVFTSAASLLTDETASISSKI